MHTSTYVYLFRSYDIYISTFFSRIAPTHADKKAALHIARLDTFALLFFPRSCVATQETVLLTLYVPAQRRKFQQNLDNSYIDNN